VSLPDGIELRPATEADLAACEDTWRESLNDYLLPLGQLEIPPDNASLRQLHAHALATDPGLFWVAVRPSVKTGEPRVIGFVAAVRRESVWFLSMLFVRPGHQHVGIGRALLEGALPGPADPATVAVATDSAQPISNGLYAVYGMTPRLPLFSLIGRPNRPEMLPALPAGIRVARFDPPAPAERNGDLERELAELDRAVLGFAHPEDHAYLRQQGRIGLAYRDASGRLLGYGYTSEVGRVGPVAVIDAALQAAVAADLLTAIPPRGASAIWVPGEAGPTMEMLLRAGLRIEGFPVLLCWSRRFADFGRYLPTSPGLL
jgi:GNAT superfamily N-acetyltransferase